MAEHGSCGRRGAKLVADPQGAEREQKPERQTAAKTKTVAAHSTRKMVRVISLASCDKVSRLHEPGTNKTRVGGQVGNIMSGLEFWYEFGSTYSYPAAMRIERLAKEAGVEVRWRPFLLGPIFQAQGWNDLPFNIFAAKGRYMWRDLTRICEAEGHALKLPPVKFPAERAEGGEARARRRERGLDACLHPRRVRRELAEQKDISEDATLGAILDALGVDVEAALAVANTPENKDALGARPRRLRRAAYSARRPSPSGTNCSGATTGWKLRSTGLSAPRPARANRALARCFMLALFSWPQAAMMSRPRGVRTGLA